MSNELVTLNSSENFTIVSGLVQRFDERGWDKIWKPLAGRPKSTVFVFDAVNTRLLYKLDSNDRVSLKLRLLDPLQGIRYKAFAVSDQSKTFRFQTEFIFGDTKIPRTILETRFHVTQSDDVAISVAEGGDPVKEVCNPIKSYLDVAFKEIRLENIDSLQHFTDRMKGTVEHVKVEHPYVMLESTRIQIELPKSIEDAFDELQEERIKHKATVEAKKREYVEEEKEYLVKKLKRQAELELDELELSRLGFEDPQFRLLMRDPEKRREYLDQMYQRRLDLIQQSREQDQEFLKIRLDTIEKFRDKVLSEFSGVDDLRQLLILIGQTTGISSSETLLGAVATDIGQVIPQPESGKEVIGILSQGVTTPSTTPKMEDVSAGEEKEKPVEEQSVDEEIETEKTDEQEEGVAGEE